MDAERTRDSHQIGSGAQVTMSVRLLRAPVPRDILVLIAAVTVGGAVAGVLAVAPLLFITTPIVAGGIAMAAALTGQVPEWRRAALEVLAQLSGGHARELLDDLLRRASTIPAAQVEPLVSAACEAARQLSALDVHVEAFAARENADPRWRDAFERCRRGRDLLTQRLQDASAALSRWQAAQGWGENLDALARELNDESRYQQEANLEVEALLS
jgi:hypothetical protein